MAEKKAATAQKKAPAKKGVSKGTPMVCEVCGLSVVVERVGNLAIRREDILLCCSKPMTKKAKATAAKKKTTKASTAKKKATKAKAAKK